MRADADLLVCVVPNRVEVLKEDVAEEPLFVTHVLDPNHALSEANRIEVGTRRDLEPSRTHEKVEALVAPSVAAPVRIVTLRERGLGPCNKGLHDCVVVRLRNHKESGSSV